MIKISKLKTRPQHSSNPSRYDVWAGEPLHLEDSKQGCFEARGVRERELTRIETNNMTDAYLPQCLGR